MKKTVADKQSKGVYVRLTPSEYKAVKKATKGRYIAEHCREIILKSVKV